MAESPNFLRNLAADSTLAIGFKTLALPLVYITSLIMARLYGAANVGTYFIAISLLILLSNLCNLGLQQGLLYFSAKLKVKGQIGDIRRAYWQAMGIVFLLSIVVSVGLYEYRGLLAEYFRSPNLPAMLVFFGAALPIFVSVILLAETVRGLGGVRWATFQESLLLPLVFLVMILLFYAGRDYVSPASAIGASYLIALLICLIFLTICPWSILRVKEKGTGKFSILNLFAYSWPLFLNSIVGLSMKSFDTLILGIFTSPEDVAYYGIAIRTVGLIILPLLAINAVVSPLFAKFHQLGDLRSLEAAARATSRWMYFMSLPLTIIIILLAPEILSFFGTDFVKAQLALCALAIGQFTNVATGSVGIILAMTGNQKTLILIQGGISICLLPLMVVGAAYYGLNGLALANGFGLAGVNLIKAWAVWRRLEIKVFANGIWWANLAGLMGIGLFYVARPYVGPLGAAGFFGLGYLALMSKKIKHELSGILPYRLSEA